MLRTWTAVAALSIAINVGSPLKCIGQSDSVMVTGTRADSVTVRQGDPMGALWRSAVIPGWGQIHNGQLYKTPIIIGVLGTLVGFAIYNNNLFHELNEAYLYSAYLGEEPHPFPEYVDSYNKYSGYSASTLRSQRDNYRRNKNLFIIGTVLVYGLNVLDAYVNGQLVGFDVGEDLHAGLSIGAYGAGPVVRLRF
jgi:hypothetical protein